MSDWKCKKCGNFNTPTSATCSNCGAKKPISIEGPLLYICIVCGIILVIMVVSIFYMIKLPEQKYKDSVRSACNDKQISKDEEELITKIQKRWNVPDSKAEIWKNEILKNDGCMSLSGIEQKYKEIVQAICNDKQISEDEEEQIVQFSKQWNIAVQEAKKWQDDTAKDCKKKAEIQEQAKRHLQQGRNHADKKEYDKAIEEFTLAIEIYPPYADAYSNRAAAYIQLKNYDKALEDLNEAYQKDPENAYINYNRAALYSLRKEIDLSLNFLDKSLELGFNRYDILEKDPDLNNIRNAPEYRKILEKHKISVQ